MRYDSEESVATASIAKAILYEAATRCAQENRIIAKQKNEDQIARMAEEVAGWFWNRRKIGIEAARKQMKGNYAFMYAGYAETAYAQRAERIAKMAGADHIGDIRIPEDDIILLRPYLDTTP
jgi:hypothetical protein